VPAGPDAVGTTGIEPRAGMPADDGSVTTSIQAKFFRDSALKSRHIDVATQSGIVTLRGAVANDNERAQARLLAWTTQGVRRMDDVLTVDPSIGQAPAPIAGQAAPAPETAPAPAPAAAASQDAPLEQRVRARLQSDSQIAQSSITVSARDGVVLLDGTVPNAAAKQRAIAAARETEGVVQIVDRISVGRAR
jgi:osmotically-inducible protein OsmY